MIRKKAGKERVRVFRSREAKLRRAQEEDEASDLSGRLVTILKPYSAAAEAYRTLRTNLLYAVGDPPLKVVMLTSSGLGEGTSTTCANLSVLLAQADKSVLLVDCDFRKPVLHEIFELSNTLGIADILVGEHSVQEVWHEPLPGLKVLTAGPNIPPNPAELLGSKRFAGFLGQMRQEFDYVLIDASPVQLVSDPAVLATQSDGVLLIIDAQNTSKGSLWQSMRSLEAVGANVLGTVMNNVKAS